MPRGGKRAGAGRPQALARQLKEATALVTELQVYVKSGLDQLGAKLPDLIKEELENALEASNPPDERRKSRQFLIKLFMEAVPIRDERENPLQELVKSWQQPQFIKVEGDAHFSGGNLAEQSEGHITEAPYRVVE